MGQGASTNLPLTPDPEIACSTSGSCVDQVFGQVGEDASQYLPHMSHAGRLHVGFTLPPPASSTASVNGEKIASQNPCVLQGFSNVLDSIAIRDILAMTANDGTTQPPHTHKQHLFVNLSPWLSLSLSLLSFSCLFRCSCMEKLETPFAQTAFQALQNVMATALTVRL